ncbi:nicotinate-nucleotide--dimethylbenzimidazole phosphoribosyltransferase [Lentilactobacillus raoultii]|uniref:Nicotinate-nucleotide--dimethylbenzimidazole phosphoribosyltransferase n=1 Tax=Lentilactobacillus raoultii TaxID=1987503 RepID=A0ABW3PD99_9LACO|nr:nicotinate-nucleotide--dimethylbenzimidazole phosphoribosyltransferase [Lentilactobacillus raoultii]
MSNWSKTLPTVSKVDRHKMQVRLNHLCKPIGGLGKLEELAIKLAGIEHTQQLKTSKRCCLVFAADHGIVSLGVSATPRKVTAIQAVNTVNGHTTIASLAKQFNCDVKVIDVGVAEDLENSKIIHRKIRYGTANMMTQPAMSYQEALRSINIGREQADLAIRNGNDLLLIGELGMANTTASSAILAAAYGLSVQEIVGFGSAISEKRYQHKKRVIQEVLNRRQPDSNDPIDILSKVGGFEIGANAGVILESARQGIPVVLDGFISIAALSIAQKIYPNITDYVIPSHLSHEKGMKIVLEKVGLHPILDLHLAVGEGSGAALLLPMIDAIQALLANMNTLEDLHVGFVK